MAQLDRRCPECAKQDSGRAGAHFTLQVTGEVNLRGVITCLYHHKVRIPVAFENSWPDSTAPTMPVAESERLDRRIPQDVRQDIEEAEECHFNRTYKAASVMCRRALQLAYEVLLQKHISGKQHTLGSLIPIAKENKC